MTRRIIAVLLLVLVVVMPVSPARAGWTWCPGDPIVLLDGKVVDITVAIPPEYVPLVNGPTYFEIRTPPQVARELVLADLGYNGHGNEIVFMDGGESHEPPYFRADIKVRVPIDESRLAGGETVPAQLRITIDDGMIAIAEGTSKHVTARVTLAGR